MIKLKDYFNKSVKLFELDVHTDNRGFFFELYSQKKLRKFGIKEKFVQDNFSYSKNIYTIRGMHFQKKPYAQSKLIYVHQGAIQDIIIDIRKNSKTFLKYISLKISSKDNYLLYIPSGFAHGFCTLKKNTKLIYKTSDFYSKKSEETIKYNDPIINIKWMAKNKKITISRKDIKGKLIEDLKF